MNEDLRRVAVTGAAGYIGSRLIAQLERDESIERIVAIDVRPLRGDVGSKVVLVERDVTTPLAGVLAQLGIQSLVHLAFILNPGHNSRHAYRVNVEGASSVFESCIQAGVGHILYLSSSSVYGARPTNPTLLSEESPARPLPGFQYSEDKAQAEALLDEVSARHPKVRTTILRTCPVMGPGADNFISRSLSRSLLVKVIGYDPPVQFLHEDDLLDVMHRCLTLRMAGKFNLGGHDPIPWSEAVSILGRRLVALPAALLYPVTALTWGLRIQSQSPARGLDFIRYSWVVSTEKIKRELGVQPRYSSREALESFSRQPREPGGIPTRAE